MSRIMQLVGGWVENFEEVDRGEFRSVVNGFNFIGIASALSKICRFGGHCSEFYSVAEHSLRVAELVSPELRLPAILHDAHEAFTGFGDVVSGAKTDFVKRRENILDFAIATEVGFPPYLFQDPEILDADLVLLSTEWRDLKEPWMAIQSTFPEPLEGKIEPLHPGEARKLFFERVADYYEKFQETNHEHEQKPKPEETTETTSGICRIGNPRPVGNDIDSEQPAALERSCNNEPF